MEIRLPDTQGKFPEARAAFVRRGMSMVKVCRDGDNDMHDAWWGVVDLSRDDTETGTSFGDYYAFASLPVEEDVDSPICSSSPTSADWMTSDEDECDVVARMAGAEWDVVEGMMVSRKMLQNSALFTIIMPNQQVLTTGLSRRGGRRGTASRTRRVWGQ